MLFTALVLIFMAFGIYLCYRQRSQNLDDNNGFYFHDDDDIYQANSSSIFDDDSFGDSRRQSVFDNWGNVRLSDDFTSVDPHVPMFGDDHGFNPSTGLAMVSDSVDAGGNSRGFGDHISFGSDSSGGTFVRSWDD